MLTHIALVNFMVSAIIGWQSKAPTRLSLREKDSSPGEKLAYFLFILASIAITAAFVDSSFTLEINSIAVQSLAAASLLSWLSLLSTFFLGSSFLRNICSLAMSISLLAYVLFFSSQDLTYLQDSINNSYLWLHIASALMGHILTLSASILALLYLWVHRALKQKKFSQLSRGIALPPIDIMERILLVNLKAGFLFLCLTLLSGSLALDFANITQDSMLPKVLWAIFVWLWYAFILIARRFYYTPCQKLAKMSLLGFVMLSIIFYALLLFPIGAN